MGYVDVQPKRRLSYNLLGTHFNSEYAKIAKGLGKKSLTATPGKNFFLEHMHILLKYTAFNK